jgi:hypothetical protein
MNLFEETDEDVRSAFSLLRRMAQGLDPTYLVDVANFQISSGKIDTDGLISFCIMNQVDNFTLIELANILQRLVKKGKTIPNVDFKAFPPTQWPESSGGSGLPMIEIEEWKPDGNGGWGWVKGK